MKISTRIKEGSFVELHIDSGDAKLTSDLANLNKGKWLVPDSTIESLITTANECSRFNGTSDIDFVKNIFDAFLGDSEKQSFLEMIAPETETL